MNHEPSPVLTASRKFPVSWLVTTTVTPGSDADCWSVTRPRISAVPCCADANEAVRREVKRTAAARTRIVSMPILPAPDNHGMPQRQPQSQKTIKPKGDDLIRPRDYRVWHRARQGP